MSFRRVVRFFWRDSFTFEYDFPRRKIALPLFHASIFYYFFVLVGLQPGSPTFVGTSFQVSNNSVEAFFFRFIRLKLVRFPMAITAITSTLGETILVHETFSEHDHVLGD